MQNATAIVHVGSARGARFTQYTAEFAEGGRLAATSIQRFIYVLEGELAISGRSLRARDYAYLPAACDLVIESLGESRAAVIEKPYQSLPGRSAPEFFSGREGLIEPKPLLGDAAIEVRCLLPDDPAFDCAVNTMTFQPGAALPMVEIHVMEHGLLMLAGGGIYRLGDCWYPVTAGDFIWMAPHCPQWFGALGNVPARYLIYKDWNR
jgi:(S)-ureidoglycine aminohydrolase